MADDKQYNILRTPDSGPQIGELSTKYTDNTGKVIHGCSHALFDDCYADTLMEHILGSLSAIDPGQTVTVTLKVTRLPPSDERDEDEVDPDIDPLHGIDPKFVGDKDLVH